MLIVKIKLDSTCLLDRHTLNLLAAVVITRVYVQYTLDNKHCVAGCQPTSAQSNWKFKTVSYERFV